MPTAGKIFIRREQMPLQEVKQLLEGYEVKTRFEEGGADIELIDDIVDLRMAGSSLYGVYRSDGVDVKQYRHGLQIVPYTAEAPFVFTDEFLIVIARKQFANAVANKLSVILHGEMGAIAEPVLNARALREFYEGGEGTRILLLDDVLIPNMDKLTMYGPNVVQTNLYGDYINEGTPWYIVVKTLKRGYTVGLVRDGAVVIFNTVGLDEFLEFVEDDVVPLILRRRHSDSNGGP